MTTPQRQDDFGIQISELTADMAERFNISTADGVIVSEVEAGSKADVAGLQIGDIIKEINRKPVKDVAEYRKMVRDIKEGGTIQLFIRRMNQGFLVVKLEK